MTEINGQTLCVVRAPLFTDKNPVEINIHTFSQCQQSRCLKLYQTPPVIIDFFMEDVYFPEQCFGPTPRACQLGVKYDKKHQPCLHGLH